MKEIKIEVIGSGCKKCKALFELTEGVVKELNINTVVLYSTDVSKIITMGIMSSPVVMINEKPVLIGMLPDKEKLKNIIYKNVFNESAKIEISENKAGGCCSCGGSC